MAQKVRPALVISILYSDTDRALIGVVSHTTAVRGSQLEVCVPVRFLQEGAFLVQGRDGFGARGCVAVAGGLGFFSSHVDVQWDEER